MVNSISSLQATGSLYRSAAKLTALESTLATNSHELLPTAERVSACARTDDSVTATSKSLILQVLCGRKRNILELNSRDKHVLLPAFITSLIPSCTHSIVVWQLVTRLLARLECPQSICQIYCEAEVQVTTILAVTAIDEVLFDNSMVIVWQITCRNAVLLSSLNSFFVALRCTMTCYINSRRTYLHRLSPWSIKLRSWKQKRRFTLANGDPCVLCASLWTSDAIMQVHPREGIRHLHPPCSNAFWCRASVCSLGHGRVQSPKAQLRRTCTRPVGCRSRL